MSSVMFAIVYPFSDNEQTPGILSIRFQRIFLHLLSRVHNALVIWTKTIPSSKLNNKSLSEKESIGKNGI